MLALSPPLFSTTYGWPLGNLVIENLHKECNEISVDAEANSYNCLLDFPPYHQIRNDFVPENSISSEEIVNGYTDDPMKVVRKLNHNASERDRRKRINDLYAFLRSLLPMSSDQKKKESIPGTVLRALKYIPELQKEVETLIRKKEKLLLCSSSRNINGIEHLEIKNQSAKEAMIQVKSTIVSVNVLQEKEAVILLISSTNNINKNKEFGFLSKALEYLEREDGLLLINATTFNCFGDRRLNTLHFQVEGNHKFEAETLREKLCSLYQPSHELLSIL